jgi:four helix bundle protein
VSPELLCPAAGEAAFRAIKKPAPFKEQARGQREHANSPGRSPGADDIKIAKKIDSGDARVHICIITRWSGFVKEARTGGQADRRTVGRSDRRTGGQADRKRTDGSELIQAGSHNRSTLFRMMPYERFQAWRVAHELALDIYRVTERWPAAERYHLTAQTRRAALSAPTNIAEGAAKRGPREFRRYLDIARGSLSELSYLLLFSRDLGILDEKTFRELSSTRDQVGKLTWGLYHSLAPARRS